MHNIDSIFISVCNLIHADSNKFSDYKSSFKMLQSDYGLSPHLTFRRMFITPSFAQCHHFFYLHSWISEWLFRRPSCDLVKQRLCKLSSLIVPQAYHVCLYSLSTQHLVNFEISLALESSETLKYFCTPFYNPFHAPW